MTNINFWFISLLIISLNSYAQEKYFIKFSYEVSKEEGISKINSKIAEIFSEKPYESKVTSFAGLNYTDDPEIQKIFFIELDSEIDSVFLKELGLEYIQKSRLLRTDILSNDSLVSTQWGLTKINIKDAWDVSVGSDSIIVAVIDTGIDYYHPDLNENLFINLAEDLNGNGFLDAEDIDGLDNDNNGFIDDVIGWDFTDRKGFPFDSTGGDYLTWDNDPFDNNGHGTNVAGVIGAISNNGMGISGVVKNIRIMNLRSFDPGGYGEEEDAASAILYAVNNGAKVINMSFGDNSFSFVLRDVIRYAYSKGVVLVGSAGNSNSKLPHYPSAYPEVISLGASTEQDVVAGFSNKGSTIDLVAPGQFITTLAPGYEYTSVSGTSFSAPYAAGVAALLLSKNDYLPSEIKSILKSTSTDIAEPGWDIRSGAGRLDAGKALKIGTESIFAFTYPRQDFSTASDTINISATVLSPYFISYSLDWGLGYNPENWQNIFSDGNYQVFNQKLATLNFSGLPDTVATLRLILLQSNGRSMEERINFYIDRTPPVLQPVIFGPALFGEKPTIFASLATDDKCVSKMFYRKQGSADDYEFITLDGLSTNNRFVKNFHYGFIPKDLIRSDQIYEIYFEVENLSGLVTSFWDEGEPFRIKTDENFNIVFNSVEKFSLPAGRIFPDQFLDSGNNSLLINEDSNSRFCKIYEFDSDSLVVKDSLYERRPKSVTDINNDGKPEILSNFVRDMYLDLRTESGSYQTVFGDSSGSMWPVTSGDFDSDGFLDIVGIKNSEQIFHLELDNSYKIREQSILDNFTSEVLFGNSFGLNNGVIGDADNDGKIEFTLLDNDGDIILYEFNSAGKLVPDASITTYFWGKRNNISLGDFDGNGLTDIAVLLQSFPDVDIAPFYTYYVTTLSANKTNDLDYGFVLDPSVEFDNGFADINSSIRIMDLNNDGKKELILFTFPYVYIREFNNQKNKSDVVFYAEGINSENIFVGDIDSDSLPEIGFPGRNSVQLIQFGGTKKIPKPLLLDCYAEKVGTNSLQWTVSGDTYFIYRKVEGADYLLMDSTNSNQFLDSSEVSSGKYYNYKVLAYDSASEEYSLMSEPVKIFNHTPGKIESVLVPGNRNLIVKSSEKVNNTIENLGSFFIKNLGTPNSVTSFSENSYLLSFNDPLVPGDHEIIISGLRDFYRSPIPPDTVTFTIEIVENEDLFYITNLTVRDEYRIKLTFNRIVAPSNIGNPANYQVSPSNPIEGAILDPSDSSAVIITFSNRIRNSGIEYQLHVKGLVSRDGVTLTEGSGSKMIISNFAHDLSDVFVYPNPYRKNKFLNDKLMFANLTQKANIYIFSLNGNKINEIEETDGNGGVEWDLKDKTGKPVSSGIYFYLIKSIDKNGNVVEEKIGKFAVIQ